MKIKKLNEMNNDSYLKSVKSHLFQIICDVRGISEKSFDDIDALQDEMKNFYENPDVEYDIFHTVQYFEREKCREEYCAEKIFDDFGLSKKI